MGIGNEAIAHLVLRNQQFQPQNDFGLSCRFSCRAVIALLNCYGEGPCRDVRAIRPPDRSRSHRRAEPCEHGNGRGDPSNIPFSRGCKRESERNRRWRQGIRTDPAASAGEPDADCTRCTQQEAARFGQGGQLPRDDVGVGEDLRIADVHDAVVVQVALHDRKLVTREARDVNRIDDRVDACPSL